MDNYIIIEIIVMGDIPALRLKLISLVIKQYLPRNNCYEGYINQTT